jgi:hypothetical protein
LRDKRELPNFNGRKRKFHVDIDFDHEKGLILLSISSIR